MVTQILATRTRVYSRLSARVIVSLSVPLPALCCTALNVAIADLSPHLVSVLRFSINFDKSVIQSFDRFFF
jgi:hypothetical protein